MHMEFSAQMIAQFLGGTVEGDINATVTTVAKIEEGHSGALSFLANPKYTPYIYSTDSTIVLVNSDFVAEHPVKTTLVRVANAYEAFAQLLQLYDQAKQPANGIEQYVFISPKAQVAKDVYIGAFTYIADGARIGSGAKIYPQVYVGKNVVIGDNTILFPGVKIYDDCIIGSNCTIHSGAVVGADGFGFAPQADSNYRKIPQIGNVVIEDYVELGANVTVDRATMGSTFIRKGVKLDDHVHIAHNVDVGENTVMAAQCGVAGSAKIGKNCMFGGQVGIAPHSKIADRVMCGAQSGITGEISKEGVTLLGSPTQDVAKARRSIAAYNNLPQMVKRLNELEHTVTKMTEEIKNLKNSNI